MTKVVRKLTYMSGIVSFLSTCEKKSVTLQVQLHLPDGVSSAGIFQQTMGARNRVGIGMLYRPARLHRLAALFPWNRFLCSIKV